MYLLPILCKLDYSQADFSANNKQQTNLLSATSRKTGRKHKQPTTPISCGFSLRHTKKKSADIKSFSSRQDERAVWRRAVNSKKQIRLY